MSFDDYIAIIIISIFLYIISLPLLIFQSISYENWGEQEPPLKEYWLIPFALAILFYLKLTK